MKPVKNPRAERISQVVPLIMGTFHDIRPPHPDEEALTMRQYQALIVIYSHGQLTPSELCEKLSLAPSTATELVNRMIAKGYLQKEEGVEDRRKVVLRVSESGRKIMEERQQLLTQMFERFLGVFGEEDQEEFTSCFERIAALIEKYRPALLRLPKSELHAEGAKDAQALS